jgi:hypothetical protein
MNYSLGNMLGGAGVLNRFDPDAKAYIAAVEVADGQALEPAIRTAYNKFILGCKSDGIWDAIKASCILAGARSLSGAMVPLKGSAPTNNNFVSGDYVRTTGLVGDGTTKFINSNRANNADPQNSNHNAVWVSTIGTGIAIASKLTSNGSNQIGLSGRKNRNLSALLGVNMQTGLCGTSRSNSAVFNYRVGGSDNLSTQVSETSSADNVAILGDAAVIAAYGNHRLAFYSIGEAIDLAALDARLATLTAAIAAALP